VTKICRAIIPVWRGKPADLLDLFGEENLQSYLIYLEAKICRATRLIWRRKSRAIRPTWRGKPA
jgi:hypothetical protein